MSIKYKLPKRTAIFEFEDGDWAGAEIRCALDVPMRTLFRFRQADKEEDVSNLYEVFAQQVLISWNLVGEDDAEIPCTPNNFLEQPNGFVDSIIKKWMEHMTQVPKDSSEISTNTAGLPGESTPTQDSPSQNPSNSSAPEKPTS